jgi:hypothetical protein
VPKIHQIGVEIGGHDVRWLVASNPSYVVVTWRLYPREIDELDGDASSPDVATKVCWCKMPIPNPDQRYHENKVENNADYHPCLGVFENDIPLFLSPLARIPTINLASSCNQH